MSTKQTLIAQGVKPTGPLGWVAAWTMRAMSDTYCGDLAGLLDLQPEDDLLEVACGSGVFLHKRASHVRHIAGLDHSEVQLKMARKRNRDRIAAGTAEIVQGDSAALPWDDNKFSAVTCNCIGCFAQPLLSLKEVHRVLLPGGRAVLSFDYYLDRGRGTRADERCRLSRGFNLPQQETDVRQGDQATRAMMPL